MNPACPRFETWPKSPARRGAIAESYRFGRRHGWTSAYYVNGRKACEGAFRDGREEGWWVFWREDGSTEAIVEFRAGAPVITTPAAMRRAA